MNSAEQQLAEFAGGKLSLDWLKSHDVAHRDADSATTHITSGWERRGAESYILDFSVNSWHQAQLVATTRLIAKACVKFACVETMEEWLERRAAVAARRIATPRLHAVGRAVLLEAYVPQTLDEAFRRASPATRSHLQGQLLTMYSELAEAGFQPRLFHDLRSHGDDVVMVDFGEDLGGQRDTAQVMPYTPAEIIARTLSSTLEPSMQPAAASVTIDTVRRAA